MTPDLRDIPRTTCRDMKSKYNRFLGLSDSDLDLLRNTQLKSDEIYRFGGMRMSPLYAYILMNPQDYIPDSFIRLEYCRTSLQINDRCGDTRCCIIKALSQSTMLHVIRNKQYEHVDFTWQILQIKNKLTPDQWQYVVGEYTLHDYAFDYNTFNLQIYNSIASVNEDTDQRSVLWQYIDSGCDVANIPEGILANSITHAGTTGHINTMCRIIDAQPNAQYSKLDKRILDRGSINKYISNESFSDDIQRHTDNLLESYCYCHIESLKFDKYTIIVIPPVLFKCGRFRQRSEPEHKEVLDQYERQQKQWTDNQNLITSLI